MIASLLTNSRLAHEIVAAPSQRFYHAPDFCAYMQRKLAEVKTN